MLPVLDFCRSTKGVLDILLCLLIQKGVLVKFLTDSDDAYLLGSSMFTFTGKVMRWAPASQIIKDYPWLEHVTRCSTTAKQLPREQRFSQNSELNLEN